MEKVTRRRLMLVSAVTSPGQLQSGGGVTLTAGWSGERLGVVSAVLGVGRER